MYWRRQDDSAYGTHRSLTPFLGNGDIVHEFPNTSIPAVTASQSEVALPSLTHCPRLDRKLIIHGIVNKTNSNPRPTRVWVSVWDKAKATDTQSLNSPATRPIKHSSPYQSIPTGKWHTVHACHWLRDIIPFPFLFFSFLRGHFSRKDLFWIGFSGKLKWRRDY
jgi:hypothetical protein